MLSDKSRMLIQTIKILTNRASDQKLSKLIDKVHSADLGHILGHLKKSDVNKIFSIILKDYALAADVLIETDTDLAVEILETQTPKVISDIFQEMYSDDSAQILERFPEDLRESVLTAMDNADQQEVEDRLDYEDETAGRIMVPDYFSLPPETTVKDTILALQKSEDHEIAYYIYVTSEEGQLVGVVSLRQLLLVKPETTLREIMESGVIVVDAWADQEEVAQMVARYNLLAIPVVDDLGKMLGIVTVDDVIDIIKDEATEDMLKMAGAVGPGETMLSGSIFGNVKIRWPWLLTSWFSGLFAFYVTGHFDSELKQIVVLAQFIPIVMGMGGNIGNQSSIIVVRGLATKVIDISNTWKVVMREFKTSLTLGTFYAIILTAVIFLLLRTGLIVQPSVPEWKLAVVIGLGVFCSMMSASIIGSLIPLILDRIHLDPAIGTGPMVASSIDVIGILVYFSIATYMLF